MTEEKQRELAYRFDLFVAPDWSERFEAIVAEHADLPEKGRILYINCGTGSRVVELAGTIEEREVVGTDPEPERIAIARAKAQVSQADRSTFVVADPRRLEFADASFDAVVLDASLTPPADLGEQTSEAVRVARPEAPVVVKTILRGSFDEFYSILWEALHDVGISDEVWGDLEPIVTGLPTYEAALNELKRARLRKVSPHRTKEEWRFENGGAFLEAPLVTDVFLASWLAAVPQGRLDEVLAAVRRDIDESIDGTYFDVAVKTLVAVGVK